ncbi:zinc ribbon domain-containing protein [Chryseobacterium sp.]|uniref:zinc ribbon domain-containing protein n=1 Tax=Chryseobacterium sp. TaxID=1871047 RepID=UPI00289F7173|nr:zinc ribbon domain-containing protein [Chryseobacterium sp.]
MDKVYKKCQSCSMPLKKSPNRGGTNSDGTISTKYCGYCYEKGQFTQPDITAKEMQDFVKHKMKDMGFPAFLAGLFSKGIPKLERWKH